MLVVRILTTLFSINQCEICDERGNLLEEYFSEKSVCFDADDFVRDMASKIKQKKKYSVKMKVCKLEYL